MSKRTVRIMSIISIVIDIFLAAYCCYEYGFVAAMGWLCMMISSIGDYLIYGRQSEHRL